MMEDMKIVIRQWVAGTNIEGASEFKERAGWKPPIQDWVKLNVDSAFSNDSNIAACGGLLMRNRHI